MSFDFSPTPSGIDQNQEYSFFSDHLAPLSQDPAKDAPSPLPETSYNNAENSNDEDFNLFAPLQEPLQKQRPKLFADKKSKPDSNQEPLKTSTPSSKKNKKASLHKTETENTKLKGAETAPQKNTSKISLTAETPEDSLAILKRNVKNILNNIPTSSTKPKTQSQSKKALPKGATLRVEPANELHLANVKNPKKTRTSAQTTMAHVAERNKQKTLNQSGHEPANQPVIGTPKKTPKTGQAPSSTRPSSIAQNLKQDTATFNPVIKRARTQKKGRTEQRSASNEQHRQAIQKEINTPRFIPLDKINDLQDGTLQALGKQDAPDQLIDKAGLDADTNSNQLGKGTSNTQALKSKGGKLPHIARAARATNWLKVLSERTSMLDKSNPHWKVLEMKLDKGEGSMTVRVMKEDDFVSVAVNFSDPEVKAIAEAKYNEIIQDLEKQYQQEVKFTFNGEGRSAFESFSSTMPHRSKSRPIIQPIARKTQDAHADKTHTTPEKNVWIG